MKFKTLLRKEKMQPKLTRQCQSSHELRIPNSPVGTCVLRFERDTQQWQMNGSCWEWCVVCAPAPVGIVQQDDRPVTIQDSWRLIHRGLGHTTRISQSVLSIEDFETIDAGYYICTAQNLQGQTTVATTVESSWLGRRSINELTESPLVSLTSSGVLYLCQGQTPGSASSQTQTSKLKGSHPV